MANSVFTVANWFINRSRAAKHPIDPLKLQKLIYIAHGYSLAFTGAPLIREQFMAWKYGPVVPELYQEFKKYRSQYIEEEAPAPKEDIPGTSVNLMEQVWDLYKDYSAVFLSGLTHEQGSAWSLTYDSSSWSSAPIPDALIREEFRARISRAQGPSA